MHPYITIFNKEFSTYGVLMFVGILVVFILAFNRVKKENILIDDMFIIAAFSVLFSLMGASILYAFVTYPIQVIVQSVLSGNFEVFGGLVYYGGLLGGVVGSIIGINVAKVEVSVIERSIVPFLPIGHAIGRIGCVMAGCCNGMEYEGLFAISYPNSILGLSAEQKYFPVQILEAILNIIIAIVLIKYSKKERKKYSLLFWYFFGYGITRFFLEFLRGDEARGLYFGISTSQIISAFLLVISLTYFCIIHRNKKDV